jgi:hypothetical protein
MNLIRAVAHSMVSAVALSVTTFGTVSAEQYQRGDQVKAELSQSLPSDMTVGLRDSGFSPQQATFIRHCITWASEARPDVDEREVWMFCAKALIRLETLRQRKETTYST